MGIFSGLEKFGIKNLEDKDIIEKKKTKEQIAAETVVVEKKEEDFLFDRKYVCPVCDFAFTSKSVRASGVKPSGKDTDLRPTYEIFDPLKYDAITCDKCGYSAIQRYFKSCTPKQGKMIKENLSADFSGIDNDLTLFSYDDAITRHKLALACTVIKRAKNSERAYTCLKLAWVLRGKRQTLDIKDANMKEEIKSLYLDERECLENAYEGFTLAMQNEDYPIAGMDELTLKYMLADTARKLKKFDVALKFVGDILTNKGAANRIKDEAFKEKELIRHDMKATGN